MARDPLLVIGASGLMAENTTPTTGGNGPIANGNIATRVEGLVTKDIVLNKGFGGLVVGDTALMVIIGSLVIKATALTVGSNGLVIWPPAPTVSVLSHRFWWFDQSMKIFVLKMLYL